MQIVTPDFKGHNLGTIARALSRTACSTFRVSSPLTLIPAKCVRATSEHMPARLDNVDRVLKAAGVSRNQVVMCRVYTPSTEYWGPINEVYAEFFGEHKPARVIVSTTTLHFGCLVEIEVVAELSTE